MGGTVLERARRKNDNDMITLLTQLGAVDVDNQ